MLVTSIIVFACILTVLLILVVLIQNSKGGGLSGELGGLGSNQLMGVKKTTDFIEKLTWGLILTLIGLCLVAGMVLPNKDSRNEIGTKLQEQIENAPAATKPNTPAQQPAQQQTQPAQQPAQQQPNPAPAK